MNAATYVNARDIGTPEAAWRLQMSTKSVRARTLSRHVTGVAQCGAASRHADAAVACVRLATQHITAAGNARTPRGSVGTGPHVDQPLRCARVSMRVCLAFKKTVHDLSHVSCASLTLSLRKFVEYLVLHSCVCVR